MDGAANRFKIFQLRALVLVSIAIQIILVFMGNRRKYTKKKWVAAIIWFFYLSADSVAILALGVLTQAKCELKNSYTIAPMWAPFLLLHLGGPDTITAYAMADNELWLRHLLGLLTQASVAFIIFFPSLTYRLNFICLLIFVVGLIKNGERIRVLYSSSKDRYRNSLASQPDPGPNYPKFMDEKVSKVKEGYRVSLGKAVDRNLPSSAIYAEEGGSQVENREAFLLEKANSFFGTFKKLFADLILTFQDRENSFNFFNELQWEDAFSIVEIELGLVFDLFYTKSSLLFSVTGFVLRILSCSLTVAALLTFRLHMENMYPQTEVIITYILLGGAVFLELYAVLTLLVSDRMMILLGSRAPCTLSLLRCLRSMMGRKRWANSVGQYNVLDHYIKYMPKRCKACWCPKWLDPVIETLDEWRVYLDQILEKYLFGTNKPVTDELKILVFDELKTRANDGDKKKLKSYWEDTILIDEMKCFDKEDEVKFDQSLLVWHLATNICSHHQTKPREDSVDKMINICELLSEYMLHLLIMFPFMLPSGIGHIRFQDTFAEATEFLKHEELTRENACGMLSKVDVEYKPSDIKGDRSKSLFFDAQRLAQALRKIEEDNTRWEKITQAWLDMLIFAAAQCRWSDHAEKLSQGGELLTHVWLLMAHFGLTHQFQISQGYIRAKLQLS